MSINNTQPAASLVNAQGIREFNVYNLQPMADLQAPSGIQGVLLITTHKSDPAPLSLNVEATGYEATTYEGDLYIGTSPLSFNAPEKRENMTLIFKNFPVDILNEFNAIGIVTEDRIEFIESIHFIDIISHCKMA